MFTGQVQPLTVLGNIMIIQKWGFLIVFKGLEKEINSLRSDKVYVIQSYIEYLAIQGRMKRSLILIVGKA